MLKTENEVLSGTGIKLLMEADNTWEWIRSEYDFGF